MAYFEPPLAKGWERRRNRWLAGFIRDQIDEGCQVTTHDKIPGVYFVDGSKCPVEYVSVFMQTAKITYKDKRRPSKTLDFGARKTPSRRTYARSP